MALTVLLALSLFLLPWDSGAVRTLPRALLLRYLSILFAAPLLLAELVRLRRINPTLLLAVCFLVFAWIRGTDTALPPQSLFSLRYYTIALISLLAIAGLDLGPRQISIMIWAFMLGCLIQVFKMYQMAGGLDPLMRANAGDYQLNYVSYCLVHASSLVVMWYRRHFHKQFRPGPLLAVLAGVALCLYGVIMTATRGAFLAMIPLLLLLIIELPIKRKWVKVLLLLIAPLVIIWVLKSSPAMTGRLVRADAGTDYSSTRLDLWATAWRLFNQAPWFGIGPGQFTHPFSEQGMPVHNVFLSVLTEFGIFGWLLFMGFVSTSLIWARRQHGLFGACMFFAPWAIIAFTGAWENAYAPYAGFGLVFALGQGPLLKAVPGRT